MTPSRNLPFLKTTTNKLLKSPAATGTSSFARVLVQHKTPKTRSNFSTIPTALSVPNWPSKPSPFPTTTLKMSDSTSISSQVIVLSTSLVTFLSGFLLGVYSIRGYLISPALADERKHNLYDPLESEESDIDEDDSILDHAPNWSNGLEADKRQGLRASAAKKDTKSAKKQDEEADKKTTTPALAEPENDEECKLVLVVRTDLGMTKGKIAAQCSHATLACYKSLLRAAQKKGESCPEARILRQWERRGQAKIAVQVKSQEELLALQDKAHREGVTAESIVDAGRTQIEAGSMTVLGVGPAPRSKVDAVTGGLKLL